MSNVNYGGKWVTNFAHNSSDLGEPRYKKTVKKGDIVPFRRTPPLNG